MGIIKADSDPLRPIQLLEDVQATVQKTCKRPSRGRGNALLEDVETSVQ